MVHVTYYSCFFYVCLDYTEDRFIPMPSKVLVIEDNFEIMTVIELILKEDGHEVVSSLNSNILRDLPLINPDIILLDQWLGKEKGSDLCLQLKSNPETAVIPVVMISAATDAEIEAGIVGADAFIKKPFDIDELSMIIKKLATTRLA